MEILRFESLPSTNSELSDLSKKNAKSWTVVWTSNQTSGKGYAGNIWQSEKDENLAVSVLIKSDLTYDELIYFNQWVCNVLANFLKEFSSDVAVKWPNDIILKNKKICGVLIETHKSDNQLNIITGIGLNVNQTNFEFLPKAGSLATQLDQKFDLEEILSGLLTKLERFYSLIENKEWEKILEDYNQNLFRKNQISNFKENNRQFEGIILEVDERGMLWIEDIHSHEIRCFQHKEIEMIY